MLKVLITGSNGFIGKNLKLSLNERKDIEILNFNREHKLSSLDNIIKQADFIFHLAGINRTDNSNDFIKGNINFTNYLCKAIINSKKKIPIVFASSIQANNNSPYGLSKKNAEEVLINLKKKFQIPIYIFRLQNVFGKWCKPNYNSVIATFCYNICREIKIHINDENKILQLVYIDDVINKFVELINFQKKKIDSLFIQIEPTYKISVGELSKQLHSFKKMANSKILENVGTGLIRALYSTYISYLPPEKFSYLIEQNKDNRGSFVEIFKTKNSGQISYFTTLPGVTRGGHYHNSKTEKFLVIKGKACFKFFNMDTKFKYELKVNSDNPEIVETIPGWSHSITNIGKEEMITVLWSNEIFDPDNPDTFSHKI